MSEGSKGADKVGNLVRPALCASACVPRVCACVQVLMHLILSLWYKQAVILPPPPAFLCVASDVMGL